MLPSGGRPNRRMAMRRVVHVGVAALRERQVHEFDEGHGSVVPDAQVVEQEAPGADRIDIVAVWAVHGFRQTGGRTSVSYFF